MLHTAMQSALLLFGISLKSFVDAVAQVKQNKDNIINAIDQFFGVGDPEDVYEQIFELIEGFAGKSFS